ncbi:MAG: SdpI family protein [Candidatus Pacebacteria bacterium]|jgi:uncharacterized membrane protein|nr:SdpI family protein [Candidatus Paceibacterota bacterium]
MNNFHKAIIGLLALFFGISVYFYFMLPDTIITHWGIDGQPNGWAGSAEGLFILPVVSLVIIVLFRLFASIDPIASTNPRFHRLFDWFSIYFVGFMLYLQIWVIAANSGVAVNMNQVLAPAMAVLFYSVGALIENAPRNWFMGIRTPWTISSDTVWIKTNRLGGKVFKIFGILCLPGIFFEFPFIVWAVLGLATASLWLVAYSYLEFRREKKRS